MQNWASLTLCVVQLFQKTKPWEENAQRILAFKENLEKQL